MLTDKSLMSCALVVGTEYEFLSLKCVPFMSFLSLKCVPDMSFLSLNTVKKIYRTPVFFLTFQKRENPC